MGRVRLAAGFVLYLSLTPLLENAYLKSGVTWFQDPAFKVPARPALTFHCQPCLSRTCSHSLSFSGYSLSYMLLSSAQWPGKKHRN